MGEVVLTSYLSHGAPTSLVEKTKIHEFYSRLGAALTKRGIDTIVISSPHYVSPGSFEIESRESIPCIQDYSGFPEELYNYSYDAKNNLALVELIHEEASRSRIAVKRSDSWGLDHGAWLPLYFMFPGKNVRVVPVSITSASPMEHFRFGEAIKAAINKSGSTAAVIGTGSPLHRLDLIRYGYYGEEKFEPGKKFDESLISIVSLGNYEKMLSIADDNPSLFRAAAPEGRLNPFFTALGSSDRKKFLGKTVVHEFMYYGVSLIAMILSADEVLAPDLVESNPEPSMRT